MRNWIGSRWRPLLLSACALVLSANLWRNRGQENERQAQVVELVGNLPVVDSDRIGALILRSPDGLLMSALLTGFMIALALAHWPGNQR